MIMKLKSKIRTKLVNSHKFCLSKGLLLFKEGKYILVYNNNLFIVDKLPFDQDINSIQVLNNNILILDDLNIPALYEIDTDIKKKEIAIEEHESFLWESFSTFDKFIIQKKISIFTYIFGIYYTKKRYKIYFDNKFSASKIINNMFFSIDLRSSISLCSEEEGNILWQFSIADFPAYISGFGREEKADIKQIIGVYDNILWVHIGGFRLVGIAIDTGKMVHYIENVVKGGEQNNFLDSQNGVLKTLSFDYYAEFDLRTLTFRKKTTIKHKEDIKIRASNYYEGDNCLYFCGYHNNKFDKPNAFGIFDTKKSEIIWFETSKDDLGYFYNPPQANDKLLAVLDDKHNLLIYDRIDG